MRPKRPAIEVFTVGYGDVDRNLLASMATTTMPTDDPGFRTTTCDTRENTDGDHFFCLPIAGDLSTVLHQAALQLTGGSRLVQLYPRPIVTSISPTTGPAAGGTRRSPSTACTSPRRTP